MDYFSPSTGRVVSTGEFAALLGAVPSPSQLLELGYYELTNPYENIPVAEQILIPTGNAQQGETYTVTHSVNPAILENIRKEFLQTGWMTYKEKDDIDLVLEKTDRVIALEFETGKNNTGQMKKNIEKLIKYKADLKFIVATNQVALNKIDTILSNTDFPDQDTITLVLARDLIKSLPTNL